MKFQTLLISLLTLTSIACGNREEPFLDRVAARARKGSASETCFKANVMIVQYGVPPFEICNLKKGDTSLAIITDGNHHAVAVNRLWNVPRASIDSEFVKLARDRTKDLGRVAGKCVTDEGARKNIWATSWGTIALSEDRASSQLYSQFSTDVPNCRIIPNDAIEMARQIHELELSAVDALHGGRTAKTKGSDSLRYEFISSSLAIIQASLRKDSTNARAWYELGIVLADRANRGYGKWDLSDEVQSVKALEHAHTFVDSAEPLSQLIDSALKTSRRTLESVRSIR